MFKKLRKNLVFKYKQATMKIVTGEAGSLKLVEVNPETKNVMEAFGITLERYEELKEQCHTEYHKQDSTTSAMVASAKYFKHANELAFMYHIFQILDREHGVGSGGGIAIDLGGLLKKLFK